jgi:hypothetical protein
MRGWLRRQLAHSVVVHTTTDASISGILEFQAHDGIVLRAARFLEGSDQISLGGETFIPREKIALVQVMAAGDERR